MSATLPGATVGVLGSGQLGRMFAIAARRMGYRLHPVSPDSDTPTGQVADREYQHAYDDLDAVREFARGVSVVTFEFENVPAEAVEAAEALAAVRASGAGPSTPPAGSSRAGAPSSPSSSRTCPQRRSRRRRRSRPSGRRARSSTRRRTVF